MRPESEMKSVKSRPATIGSNCTIYPYCVLGMAAQDRKLLAIDVIKMLLPPSLDAMPQTSLVVSDAVRLTRGARMSSIWDVVSHLESMDEPHGKVVDDAVDDGLECLLSGDNRAEEDGRALRMTSGFFCADCAQAWWTFHGP